MADDRVRWARSGDANIAYRVMGDGPMDLLFVSALISHIEVLLEEPGLRRFFERLAGMARLILVDRRGSGLSDPVRELTPVETEVADLEAVLDAVGSDRTVLMSYAAGGALAIEFAARRPERTLALVLYACIARSLRNEEIDWAWEPEERAERFASLVERWGTGTNMELMAPSVAEDPRMREWLGRLERSSMTPTGLEILAQNLAGLDVREHLPKLRVPTLVLHRRGDQFIDPRHSRYVAEHVPGARYVELPGDDSLPMVGDTESLLGEVEEFLAARLGDARWRDLLTAHDAAVRREVERFGGREVKTVGDGFIAAFAGPPSEALRCARAIVGSVRELGIELRAGLHTGECELLDGKV